MKQGPNVHLHVYAFSRQVYPKATYSTFRLYMYCQYMCSLGIEPTTFVLLTQCSTTEPQEHVLNMYSTNVNEINVIINCHSSLLFYLKGIYLKGVSNMYIPCA